MPELSNQLLVLAAERFYFVVQLAVKEMQLLHLILFRGRTICFILGASLQPSNPLLQ